MSSNLDPIRHLHGRTLRAVVGASASIALVIALFAGFAFARYIDVMDVGKEDILTGPVVPTRSPGDTSSPVPETSRCAEQPCNYLILGSDSRAGLSEEELKHYGTDKQIGGENRADTIMLVHLDPNLEKTIILSFPRDLWVEIPEHGFDKINAAFEGGIKGDGAELMARTVANLTGLRIDHVLYIDLNGFQEIVDTLGGVDMCIPGYNADPETGRLQDELTGLDIKPGCQTLRGDQALAYVRTRHLPCDFVVPDFARIGRQQQFLRAVINQMLEPDKLVQAPTLIEPILRSMIRDERFEVGDLIFLTGELQGLTTGAVEFRSIPGYGAEETVDGQLLSVVKMAPEAEEIFDAIRNGKQITGVGETLLSTPPSEANIEIAAVDSGNPTDAAAVLDVLLRAGFAVDSDVMSTGDLGLKRRAGSAIAFAPGHDAEAGVVQTYFPQLPLLEAPGLKDHDVAIVVTGDYTPPPTGGNAPVVGCPEA